jgi:AAA+ ATPase superfamily predicted ATPase
MKFVNRSQELAFLEKCWKRKEAQLAIVYGRRRIGKTELLLRFAKSKLHVYFLAAETSEKDNLQELFAKLYELFKDDILFLERTWDNLFRYLAKKKRFVLIIDEFPYLIMQNKAISSVFQKGWDLYLKDSPIFLVLSGSSVSMMESHTLLYRAPLYGRRTGQWKMGPLKFAHVSEFFPKYSIEDIVKIYGALDAIPGYLVKYDSNSDFWENVKNQNLAKGTFLYDEVDFLLKQELREPKVYKTILKAIALGNTKFSEIMNSTGIAKSKLFIYLDTLESLHIIEKRIPVLNKPRSRRGRYFLKDNFFKFWFRYVLPNKSSIEEGNIDSVIRHIKLNYSEYIGRFVFEDVCRQFLWAIFEQLPFPPQKIDAQWDTFRNGMETKAYEIDLVGINEETKEILFCECKWQDKVNAQKVLSELKEKAAYVDWMKNNRKEYYVVFAKSFKERIKEKNILLFDLKDMQKVFKG